MKRVAFVLPFGRSRKSLLPLLLLLSLSTFNLQPPTAHAQGTTAFSYQGRLNVSGSPANGLYDLRFVVWDALTNGSVVAGPVTNSATGVTNGLFAVTLDFGIGVFTGPARLLQLDVRTNGSGSFTTLLPRQPVLPVPYALYAMTPAGPQGPVGPQGPLGTNGVVSLNGLINDVTLAAGANVTLTTNRNTLQISTGLQIPAGFAYIPDIQIFLTNGTFVVPANVTKIMVEMWGGGGGGGSGFTGITNTFAGGGGGAGGYAWNVFNVTPNTTNSVVVGSGGSGGDPAGAGGTSSFGDLLSASGGSPGGSATSSRNGAGGAGGIGSSSSIYPVRGGKGEDGGNYGGWHGNAITRGGPAPAGGRGGQVWRGTSGPGAGGNGAWWQAGEDGNLGAVLVYY